MKKFIIIIVLFSFAFGQNSDIYKLKYISLEDLVESLNVKSYPNRGYVLGSENKNNEVVIHFNKSNNQIKLIGSDSNVNSTIELIKFYDVAPKQIIIEVKIVEFSDQDFSEIGLDWNNFIDNLRLNLSLGFSNRKYDREDADKITNNITGNVVKDDTQKSIDTDKNTSFSPNISISSFSLGDLLNLMKEKDIGKIINAPRIVTTNNRLGSILDGKHSTYITKYSSYSNIYETQEINSGLSLKVTPSIGSSEYLSLDIQAKYTTLNSNISGSPVESGQILENRVIAKNNEPFLLGAFKKTSTITTNKKVPFLGSILPFIFSKKIESEVKKNILIILTPKIIDLKGSKVEKL